MRMKVDQLEGPSLDVAVAMAEGYVFGRPQKLALVTLYPLQIPGQPTLCATTMDPNGEWGPNIKRYSREWSIGGPIIERERIELQMHACSDGWWAGIRQRPEQNKAGGCVASGPTPLVAAMRAYVIAKLGAEVGLP